MRLTLEGSYFELRDYLRGIEQQSRQPGGRRLFWERLDYQVDEAGPFLDDAVAGLIAGCTSRLYSECC